MFAFLTFSPGFSSVRHVTTMVVLHEFFFYVITKYNKTVKVSTIYNKGHETVFESGWLNKVWKVAQTTSKEYFKLTV